MTLVQFEHVAEQVGVTIWQRVYVGGGPEFQGKMFRPWWETM